MDNTLIVYHRGGGKSLGYPPNSLLAIEWAINSGAKAIEFDIATVGDGSKYRTIIIEPKLLHQAGLDIDNLEWDEVKKVDAGNAKFGRKGVGRLGDVLMNLENQHIHRQIHIKGNNKQTIRVLAEELARIDWSLTVITSFDLKILKHVREAMPDSRIGWIVKPDGQSGSENGQDLTALISTNADILDEYTDDELQDILKKAKEIEVNIIILCAPRIKKKEVITFFQDNGFEVGAWGVGTNLEIARRLMDFKINRFTIDNPEQLNK